MGKDKKEKKSKKSKKSKDKKSHKELAEESDKYSKDDRTSIDQKTYDKDTELNQHSNMDQASKNDRKKKKKKNKHSKNHDSHEIEMKSADLESGQSPQYETNTRKSETSSQNLLTNPSPNHFEPNHINQPGQPQTGGNGFVPQKGADKKKTIILASIVGCVVFIMILITVIVLVTGGEEEVVEVAPELPENYDELKKYHVAPIIKVNPYKGKLIEQGQIPSSHTDPSGKTILTSLWNQQVNIGTDGKVSGISSLDGFSTTKEGKYFNFQQNGYFLSCKVDGDDVIAQGTNIPDDEYWFSVYLADNGSIALLNKKYKHWLKATSNNEILCSNNDENEDIMWKP